jgi:hypothetical protein
MKTNVHFLNISRSFLLRIKTISGKRFRESRNTHFIFNIFFFRKLCNLLDNVEKDGRAEQSTDDNTAHALSMLDN